MIQKSKLNRFGPLTGLIASIFLFIGSVIDDTNSQASIVASSSNISIALIRNQTTLLISSYLIMLGVFFLIFFVAYLRQFMLRSMDESHWLANASFGGGMVAAAMLLLSAHFIQALTVLSNYGVETQVAKAVYLLEWNWYLLVEAPALAALVGATSIVGFSSKGFPLWLNLSGILLMLLLLVPFVTGGGIVLTFIWLAALSIYLIFNSREPRHIPELGM
ncbi:MAG: hypothetical protein E4G99_02595 [Anaerolineales bacterium]|nr:MAG: hypothetical protein E4G99_02595 [Anaerolineales bacterium]